MTVGECDCERWNNRKDGTPIIVEVKGTPIYFKGEKHVLNIIRDVTQSRQAEEKIKDLALFPAQNPNPVLRIRKDGYIQFANPAAWPIIELLKTKPGELLPAEWKYVIAEIYDSQSSQEIELNHQDWVFLIKITPFAGTDYLYAYGRDITEHKQIEKKIKAHQKQLRSLAAELSVADEREQRRIATVLHDHLIQNLGFSKIRLEGLAETDTKLGQDNYLNTIEELRDITEGMIQSTRSLTFDLSPPILYDLGLEAAIEWLSEQIQQQHGILICFERDGQLKPMEDDIRSLLFQTTRELLLNVVKHAKVDCAVVSISREGEYIKIDVQDAGVGFDVAKTSPQMDKHTGFGLFNIRERLDYIGGGLEIASEPGGGTRASLVAPLSIGT